MVLTTTLVTQSFPRMRHSIIAVTLCTVAIYSCTWWTSDGDDNYACDTKLSAHEEYFSSRDTDEVSLLSVSSKVRPGEGRLLQVATAATATPVEAPVSLHSAVSSSVAPGESRLVHGAPTATDTPLEASVSPHSGSVPKVETVLGAAENFSIVPTSFPPLLTAELNLRMWHRARQSSLAGSVSPVVIFLVFAILAIAAACLWNLCREKGFYWGPEYYDDLHDSVSSHSPEPNNRLGPRKRTIPGSAVPTPATPAAIPSPARFSDVEKRISSGREANQFSPTIGKEISIPILPAKSPRKYPVMSTIRNTTHGYVMVLGAVEPTQQYVSLFQPTQEGEAEEVGVVLYCAATSQHANDAYCQLYRVIGTEQEMCGQVEEGRFLDQSGGYTDGFKCVTDGGQPFMFMRSKLNFREPAGTIDNAEGNMLAEVTRDDTNNYYHMKFGAGSDPQLVVLLFMLGVDRLLCYMGKSPK